LRTISQDLGVENYETIVKDILKMKEPLKSLEAIFAATGDITWKCAPKVRISVEHQFCYNIYWVTSLTAYICHEHATLPQIMFFKSLVYGLHTPKRIHKGLDNLRLYRCLEMHLGCGAQGHPLAQIACGGHLARQQGFWDEVMLI